MTTDYRAGTSNDTSSLVFRLAGRVDASDFPIWMNTHARKLGIRFELIERHPGHLDICAKGPQEMLDAFALACSLGPQSVFVDTVQIIPSTELNADGANSGISKSSMVTRR